MLVSIASIILGASLEGGLATSSHGFRFLATCLMVMGGVLVLLSICECICRMRGCCAPCACPLELCILGLAIFALVVTRNQTGEINLLHRNRVAVDNGFKLHYYSLWLQDRVTLPNHWENYYKNRLVNDSVCEKFQTDYVHDTLDQLHSRTMTSFEFGCCKPPEDCNFTFTSSANWTKPAGNNQNATGDCQRWSNDPKVLCFDCDTCKAGFLYNITYRWHKVGFIIILCAIVDLVLYFLCCCCCRR